MMPLSATVRVLSPSKAALTLRACDIVTLQLPVPAQPSPLQPRNTTPGMVVAASCTLWLKLKPAEHVAPQLMPAGVEVTVPRLVLVPVLVTASVSCCSVNVAVTDLAPSTKTSHEPTPGQPARLQPVKFEPAVADAVKVTVVP